MAIKVFKTLFGYYNRSCFNERILFISRYKEKQPGKFVGDTNCERQPIEICGAGCVVEEGPEECHDKKITSLLDVPEEICDLNPQKTCRLQTKLVPSLQPKHECTIIPQEVCNLKFSTPKLIKKPLMTKWCLDDSAIEPDTESYEESNALGSPIDTAASNDFPVYIPPTGTQPTRKDDPFSAPNMRRPNPNRRRKPKYMDAKSKRNL